MQYVNGKKNSFESNIMTTLLVVAELWKYGINYFVIVLIETSNSPKISTNHRMLAKKVIVTGKGVGDSSNEDSKVEVS